MAYYVYGIVMGYIYIYIYVYNTGLHIYIYIEYMDF